MGSHALFSHNALSLLQSRILLTTTTTTIGLARPAHRQLPTYQRRLIDWLAHHPGPDCSTPPTDHHYLVRILLALRVPTMTYIPPRNYLYFKSGSLMVLSDWPIPDVRSIRPSVQTTPWAFLRIQYSANVTVPDCSGPERYVPSCVIR